jgi:hypothetical protein
VITGTAWQMSLVDSGFRDAYIAWTFDPGNLPPGNLEVWERDVYSADHVVATLPMEQRSFWHLSVRTEPIIAYYKVRYVSGPDVAGPFSVEVAVRLYDAPAAPEIVSGDYSWGTTEEGFADVTLNFTFDQGSLPTSILEVWYRVGESGSYQGLDSVASDAGTFYHTLAATSETTLFYKMRYVYNDIVGPFSEEWAVGISV